MDVTIQIPNVSPLDSIHMKVALEKLAKNFNKENLQYLAELSEKPNANEKFVKLKNNKLVNSLL